MESTWRYMKPNPKQGKGNQEREGLLHSFEVENNALRVGGLTQRALMKR